LLLIYFIELLVVWEKLIRKLLSSLISKKRADLLCALLGETGRLRGRDVELRTGLMLQEWFRRHAPEYEVFMWDGTGADLLVEGKEVLASIEITMKPKAEDIRQIKSGVGAIMDDWGRKPDLLIVYSRSGIIPKKVAEIAEKMGVKLARRPADIKRMLDLQFFSH
jgi:hypothetical protein